MSAPAIISSGTAAGGPPVGGSGTPGTIPVWSSGTTLGNSSITDNGSSVQIGLLTIVNNVNGLRVTDGGGTNVARISQSGATSIFDALAPSGTFRLRTNAGTVDAIFASAAGNVGIGTASPYARASVRGGSNDGIGVWSTAVTTAGSPIGGSLFLGDANFYNAGFYNQAPGLSAVFDVSTSVAAALAFYTYSGTNRIERARIDSAGNVGIGTATPVGRADVAGTSVNQSGWGLLSVQSNDAQGADKGGSITFGGVYDASTATHWAQISGRKENGTSGQYGGYLAFATRTNGAGTNAERMRLDSLGRLLVGTATAPASASVNIVSFKASGSGGMQWHNAAGGNGGLAIVPLSSGGANLYSYTGAIGAESYGSISATLGPSSLDISSTPNYGLKLPATPGNADTQTLDCYEENTWTPTRAGFGGTNPTVTASYTRVGRLVTITVRMVATGGAQYSGTSPTTTLSLPATITPAANTTASSIMVYGDTTTVGTVTAWNDGFIYLPTFALTTQQTAFSITYRV